MPAGEEIVYAIGYVNVTVTGALLMLQSTTPDGSRAPDASGEPWPNRYTKEPSAILLDRHAFSGEVHSGRLGVTGYVGADATAGACAPVIRVKSVDSTPGNDANVWRTRDFTMKGPFRPCENSSALEHEFSAGSVSWTSGKTPENLYAAHVANLEFMESPMGRDAFAAGMLHSSDNGFLAVVDVPIVTDVMRAWLRTTPHRISLVPIARRQRP